jgi:hypothetical protein
MFPPDGRRAHASGEVAWRYAWAGAFSDSSASHEPMRAQLFERSPGPANSAQDRRQG